MIKKKKKKTLGLVLKQTDVMFIQSNWYTGVRPSTFLGFIYISFASASASFTRLCNSVRVEWAK